MASKGGFNVTVIAKLAMDSIIKDISRQVGRKEFMIKIGEDIKRLIQGRTRTGEGVSSDTQESPNQVPLKELSNEYVLFRRKGTGFTPGRFFRPAFSNLTLTGQMLDAMDIETREGFVRVFIRDTQRKGSKQTNAQVAEYVRKERPFMAMSSKEKLIVDRKIELETRRIVKDAISRRR